MFLVFGQLGFRMEGQVTTWVIEVRGGVFRVSSTGFHRGQLGILVNEVHYQKCVFRIPVTLGTWVNEVPIVNVFFISHQLGTWVNKCFFSLSTIGL